MNILAEDSGWADELLAKVRQKKELPMQNNLRGRAPPLTIRKRVRIDDQSELIEAERRQMLGAKMDKLLEDDNMSYLSDQVEKADRLMRQGNLAEAEAIMADLVKRTERNTVEDDWSEGADAEANGNNASLDDEDDLDYEDDEDNLQKFMYPNDRQVPVDHIMEPPSPVRPHVAQTYSLGTTPAVQQPKRHKFDSHVDFVQERDGVSRNEAQSRARVEFPDTFAAYQRHLAGQTTSAQQVVRGQNFVGKRSPTTYEDLVSAEMRKGVTQEIAGQRILQKYGSAALRHRAISKSVAAVEDSFVDKAEAIWMSDEGIDRTTALRKARLRNPRLYKALRSL